MTVTNAPASIQGINLDETDASGVYIITDHRNGKATEIGRLTHPTDSLNNVELYCGKGGFTAIITSPQGLKYFALPGATVQVGDTSLELTGPPITSNPSKVKLPRASSQPQTLTPQAMILGAGLATRFEPVSGENTQYAKPAVPLLGTRSVIRLIADMLAEQGFSRLFINTYFKPASLKAGLANCPQAEDNTLCYIDEAAPSGTAGGLRKLLQNPSAYGFDPALPILIVQGDAVSDVDLTPLTTAHLQNRALVSIGCQYLSNKDDVSKFGIIETDQRHPDGVSGNITSFVEKPQPHETDSQLANTGFYLFSPEAYPIILDVFSEMGDAGEKELDFAKHIFPRMLQKVAEINQDLPPDTQKTFWAQKVDGYWSDIGNPAQYLETVHDLYQNKTNHVLPLDASNYYEKGVFYWPGAKAVAQQEGVRLSGNVIVAKPF